MGHIADIVFVVDSSGSIREANPTDGSYDNWDLVLTFINDVVDLLNVAENDVRIGLVDYSYDANSIFYLNSYYTKSEIKNAVLAVPYYNSWTNTSGGIRVMQYDQFTSVYGERSNAQNIGIVITDGVANIDNDPVIESANAQAAGITMFAVGVTNAVDMVEIAGISSPPQIEGQTYWLAQDFTVLNSIAETIVNSICDYDEPVESKMEYPTFPFVAIPQALAMC